MMFKLDRGLFALLSVLTVACRGDDPGTSESESSGSTSTAGGSTTTSGETPTTSGDDTTTTGPVDDTGGDPPTTSTTNGSQGFITTQTTSESDTTPPGPGPNGASCMTDDECESMNCFQVLGMGLCAECNEDQDCVDAGTGTACSLEAAQMTAVCTMGAPGDGCMSDAACMDGLKCDAVIDIPFPGILPDTCGECSETADCEMGTLCSPSFDFAMFSGQKNCVEPGSVPNDQLCPDGVDGPAVCMSGHCTSAQIMQVIEVFICGECTVDADCDMGQTCMPAEASQAGLSGSTCV